ncbi:RE1, partial [Symbiodinium sp. CCMP2456]
EGWVQYFGHPRCLRLDPAGAFRSAAVEEWCDKHSIFLDIIPGEAHWKVGVVENAVRGAKEVMTKLCQYDPDISAAEALAEAITTFNHKEIVRGYSPAQHVLGQAPDETGRFIPSSNLPHPGLLVENPNGEVERSVKQRAEAEKALSDWNAGQRLMRAKHSRHRPSYDYVPGELVYYWRTQDSNKGRRQPGGKHGRFLGPARILATETRQGEDGKEDTENQAAGEAPRERSRSRGRGSSEAAPSRELPSAWWSTVAERHWPEQKSGYWDDKAAAVAVEIDMPDTQRGCDRALRDLGAYFIGSMKRRAIELSERKMSPEERESFRGAKAIEVRNFVASKAFEVLPDHLKPDRSQAIGMRWILTWKLREDGSRKAKARAVLLGYQDEAYEHRSTTSPVMTRQTRQLLLQLAAWKRWKVQKGDVTGAFLQSRQYPDRLFCIPCPEICQALGIPEGSVTKVQKACYGLVDAPLEWYRRHQLVSRSTVETIIKANILLSTAKSRQKQKMKIHAFSKDDELTMVMWVDAANANRVDGGSTQGLFLGMTTKAMLKGEITPVTPVSWHSQKIDRACRSPGAAEAQAAVNGEDGLYGGRHQWSELLYGAGDLHAPDELVLKTGGCVVTDSRNVYDRLVTEVMVIKGAEKRTSIELLAIKESLVEDENMMSAKRRKDLGLAPLEHKDFPKGSQGVVNEGSTE